MRFSKVAAAAAVASIAEAQRPSNTSICDYYTTALLKNNTAANQYTVLTLLVNTVVIGNYTKPNIGVTFPDIAVPGILAPGNVNGTDVSLLEYFDGSLASSNRGGSSGVAINFLDDGGAAPLMMNKPAVGTTSNQYKLLTHLYQFFGTALGCSQQGMTAFPSYAGVASQYSVHKFMALDYAEVTYFVEQVGLAAASFGVAKDDITAVATTLTNVFNRRCGPATAVIPAAGPVLQSICITDDCPEAANATCSSYAAVVQPSAANGTMASNGTMGANGTSSNGTSSGGSSSGGSSTSGSTMSPTSSGAAGASSSGHSTGAAVKSAAAGVGAAAAFAAAAFFL